MKAILIAVIVAMSALYFSTGGVDAHQLKAQAHYYGEVAALEADIVSARLKMKRLLDSKDRHIADYAAKIRLDDSMAEDARRARGELTRWEKVGQYVSDFTG